MADSRYPMCEKLSEVSDQRLAIIEFIEYLEDEHDVQLMKTDDDGNCYAAPLQLDPLIMRFFGVDEKELEKERRAMLEELRG